MSKLLLQYKTYEMLDTLRTVAFGKEMREEKAMNVVVFFNNTLRAYREEWVSMYKNKNFKLHGIEYKFIDIRISSSHHHCVYIKMCELDCKSLKLSYDFEDIEFV